MWTKTFAGNETFVAYNDAVRWLNDRGYSVGRMCSPHPTGVKKGEHDIPKWHYLSVADVGRWLDGRIEGDMRNGPVTVTLREPPAE